MKTVKSTLLALSLLPALAIAQALPQTKGEIKRIDAAQQKVSIRHEHIVNLDMPPMTMVFTTAQPGMLQGFKVGDRVLFTVAQQGSQLQLQSLQADKP